MNKFYEEITKTAGEAAFRAAKLNPLKPVTHFGTLMALENQMQNYINEEICIKISALENRIRVLESKSI